MAIYDRKGNQLSTAYDISGKILKTAYALDGSVVYERPKQFDYDSYTENTLFTYSQSNMQSFAVYNGIIAQCKQTDAIHLIDIETQTKIREVPMDIGHGNSSQFSDEFYAEGDEFPLFYVRNSGVWVYRIVGTSSELIRKYAFSSSIIGTYVAGFGVDSANKRFYTVSYTEGDYTTKTGLLRVCVWDMDNITDNENGTYSMALLDSNDLTWFDNYEAVQGCCYHDGHLFVANGTSKQSVAMIDLVSLTIDHTISIAGGEIEGCAWIGDDYMLVGQNPTNITYKQILFAELQIN